MIPYDLIFESFNKKAFFQYMDKLTAEVFLGPCQTLT